MKHPLKDYVREIAKMSGADGVAWIGKKTVAASAKQAQALGGEA